MHCTQCGAQVDQDSKFCINCGGKINQEHAAASQNEAKNPAHSEQQTKNNKQNQYVEQGKEIGRNYIQFIPQALKRPFTASQKVSESDNINGIITLVLFSLLLPLYTFTIAKKISPDFIEVPFFETVLKPLVFILIFFAILVGIKFGVSKLLNAELSYIRILTIFGSLMVLPTSLLLVSLLFLILSINVFSAILLFVALGLVSISSIATIFSIKTFARDDKGIDVVYGIIITNIAIGIILLIIGDSIVGNLIDQIQSSLIGFPF
ncbi:zinc-ribbon domain-containing protein [Oceanobacillus limi]|uniref:Zinc-ribbon domain-containing protein n=1 Tax=Oceanobacillus limi TaxID=930131 RepID=A0A1I0AAL1_9BACI|nr:zinc ribbon domain-containing protein [Oceanobacillus limi]SES90296.1 zinc-ribbon domain-containing protein [Oceanobacillus limi]